MNSFFLFTLIFTLSVCHLIGKDHTDHHSRQVYYSQFQNTCQYGSTSDKLKITVSFDDHEPFTVSISGGLLCEPFGFNFQRMHYQDQIFLWGGFDDIKYHIEFDQKIEVYRLSGIPYAIVNTIKVHAHSGEVFGKNYECSIIGNEKIYHFGPYPSAKEIYYNEPEVNVFCKNGKIK